MSIVENLNVQKWVFERGNYQIIVENGWALEPMYTQERITVNGVRVRDIIPVPASILFWRTMFKDTVLEPGGELDLKIQVKSGFRTTKSRLLIAGETQAWSEYFQLQWTGTKGEWPNQIEYETSKSEA